MSLFGHSGSHHILCCVFLRLVASFSGFFLCLIAPSVFSNVYLKYVSNLHLEEMMNIAFGQWNNGPRVSNIWSWSRANQRRVCWPLHHQCDLWIVICHYYQYRLIWSCTTESHLINVREYRRCNQQWKIPRNWQHRIRKTKKIGSHQKQGLNWGARESCYKTPTILLKLAQYRVKIEVI